MSRKECGTATGAKQIAPVAGSGTACLSRFAPYNRDGIRTPWRERAIGTRDISSAAIGDEYHYRIVAGDKQLLRLDP